MLKEMEKVRHQSRLQWKRLTLAHLERFTEVNPGASYEDWITDLHPENSWVNDAMHLEEGEIDARFYHESSDHLALWNQVGKS